MVKPNRGRTFGFGAFCVLSVTVGLGKARIDDMEDWTVEIGG